MTLLKAIERPNYAVMRVQSAIDQSVCDVLLSQAKCHPNWVSLDRYDESQDQVDQDSPRRVSVSAGFRASWQPSEFFDELAALIKKAWGISLRRFSGYGVSRYDRDSTLPLHQDTSGDDQRLITFVLYLSVATSGGEIQFPTIGLSIAPQSADILLFPSNLPHMVTPITEGDRWVVVWFGE